MPTSQLEKEQREALKDRVSKAREKHRDRKIDQKPSAVRLAERLAKSWRDSQHRKNRRHWDRLNKVVADLRQRILFSDPTDKRLHTRIVHFEKTGR